MTPKKPRVRVMRAQGRPLFVAVGECGVCTSFTWAGLISKLSERRYIRDPAHLKTVYRRLHTCGKGMTIFTARKLQHYFPTPQGTNHAT